MSTLSNHDREDIYRKANRLIQIPAEIAVASRNYKGVCRDRDGDAADIKTREMIIRRELIMAENSAYNAAKNAGEREALFKEACEHDPDLQKLRKQHLGRVAAAHTLEIKRDQLHEERKALYAFLMAYQADVWLEGNREKLLIQAIKTKNSAAA
jgi:hypothetical protein